MFFSEEPHFCDWQLSDFGGAKAFLFDSVESTHSLMKEKAFAGEIAPGTLFVANAQTGGRGRHERTWDSPAGKNLYFNILIPLDGIPSSSFAQITQVAALTFAEVFTTVQDEARGGSLNFAREASQDAIAAGAVQEATTCAVRDATAACTAAMSAPPATTTAAPPDAAATGDATACAVRDATATEATSPDTTATSVRNAATSAPRITVKWPNDILFGKSKFCGILAEIVFTKTATGEAKPSLSMGVGINVNSEPGDYAHLNREVTTLKNIVGKQINREQLLRMLIASLERAIGQFRAFGIAPWVSAWRKMDKFIGARGTIIVNNHCTDANRDGNASGAQKKTGRILDMQPDGSLLFETDDGEIQAVYSADLEI